LLFSYIRWTFGILISEFIKSLLLSSTTDIVIDALSRSRELSVIIFINSSSYCKNSGINGGRSLSIGNAIVKNEIFRDLKLDNSLIICCGYSNTALFKFIYIKKEPLNMYFAIEIHTLSDSKSETLLKLKNIKKKDKARFRIL
jgi:hypothetical protein